MIDFGKSMDVTERVLDAMTVRARVIAHNVANQNTPGFKRYQVHFEDELARAHAQGGAEGDVQPVVTRDLTGTPGQNNVSAMDELATLEKVKVIYEIFTRRAGAQFATLNKAIFGR